MAKHPRCNACCPSCRSHFDSLAAFDAHRVDGKCDFLNDWIVEYPRGGACKTTERIGVTIYGLEGKRVA